MTLTLSTPVAGPLEVPAPAWFVSDLHLTPGMPRTLAAFERLLERAACQAGSLFILGDFFEFWVGDEETDAPFAANVARLLATLSAQGVAVYLMHGNRDFLLGERFARAAGAQLLPDPTTIECAGQRVVLTHGDMLCTDDVGYMRFRAWTRKRWIQRLFLALPLSARMAVARKLRADSEGGRKDTSHDPVLAPSGASLQAPGEIPGHRRKQYGDVAPAAVHALLAASHAPGMIHGHTHRPARHETGTGFRWVLTDWDLDGSHPRAAALELGPGGFRLLPQVD